MMIFLSTGLQESLIDTELRQACYIPQEVNPLNSNRQSYSKT